MSTSALDQCFGPSPALHISCFGSSTLFPIWVFHLSNTITATLCIATYSPPIFSKEVETRKIFKLFICQANKVLWSFLLSCRFKYPSFVTIFMFFADRSLHSKIGLLTTVFLSLSCLTCLLLEDAVSFYRCLDYMDST